MNEEEKSIRKEESASNKNVSSNSPQFTVNLFKDEIHVESFSTKSSQALVFFGREKSLGVRVVLKQYVGSKKKSIMAEIKVFTLLESLRQQTPGTELVKVINPGRELPGLPLMLGYKVNKKCSEILMTHGGSNIEQWMEHTKIL
jgi:serine/threonine protein kinase